MVAHHWRLDPHRLGAYPARQYRMMAEIRERMVREHNEAIERAKQGGLAPEKKPKAKRKPGTRPDPKDW